MAGKSLSAGKAYVELSMKDGKFQSAMNNIKEKFGKLKSVGKTVLGALVKAFAAAAVGAAALFACATGDCCLDSRRRAE